MKASWTSFLLAVAAATAASMETPADMAKENGYPTEDYVVKTTDGYFLRLDRIPNPGGHPVFLSHSLFCSGTVFLDMGPDFAIAYALHDAGYDVFIGNDRSTKYSQDLTQKYNKENSPRFDKYFLFSFHEHGKYDSPAFIKKILELTGRKKLTYVGFSMGSTGFFVMGSTVPEMNDVIHSAHLMAPALSLGKPEGNFYKLLHPIHNFTRELLDVIGLHKFDATDVRNLLTILCPDPEHGSTCNKFLDFSFNADKTVDYVSNCPGLQSREPAGGSLPEALHYAQNTDYPGRFKWYDDGAINNLLKYGSVIPPDYELENIVVPTYIYIGKGDVFTTEAHIKLIETKVPGFQRNWTHPSSTFSHIDFTWNQEAVSVYKQIQKDMELHLPAEN